MTKCEKCGGPMVALFTSEACARECDVVATSRTPNLNISFKIGDVEVACEPDTDDYISIEWVP